MEINGSKIKNSRLIKTSEKKVELSTGRFRSASQIVLKTGTMLGDVFYNLPYGIIDKSVTGIGGTTLELLSERNSIIVEPLKAIASSKSLTKSNYFYVGSSIGNFPYISKQHIQTYLNNDGSKYKKFLVVADSLPRLIKTLIEELGSERVFQDFFITIDEVDSFQADSVYRDSMDLCLDYYLLFKEQQRCLITATMLDFSDPRLKNETYTIIDYEEAVSRNIKLVYTETVNATLCEEIKTKLDEDKKIVIAYNILAEVLNVIGLLKKLYKIKDDEIAVLCSKSNKKRVITWFNDVSDGILPKKINFLTSAYFTGIDIYEDYHTIAVCNPAHLYTLLSDKKLKQIAGRCRHKLCSETVIYNTHENEIKETLTLDVLVGKANSYLLGMKCFERQYQLNPSLRNELEEMQKTLVDCSSNAGFKRVRKDLNDSPAISYFNIDAYLENQRVYQALYQDKDQLYNCLKQSNEVEFKEVNFEWGYDGTRSESETEPEESLREEAIQILKEMNGCDEKIITDLINKCGSPLQERIYKQYKMMIEWVDKDALLNKLAFFSKQHDSRAFDFFKASVHFQIASSDNPLKYALMNSFKVGSFYSLEEIAVLLKQIYTQYFNEGRMISSDSAAKYLRCYFKTRYSRSTDIRPSGHKILGVVSDPFVHKKELKINIEGEPKVALIAQPCI